jgi:hypothetical protein
MMRRMIILVVSLLAGCNSMTGYSTPSSSSESTVEPVPMRTPRNQSIPRELKFKLTLDTPADLKVKQGDRIQKEQVISDRSSARKQLEQQRQAIRLKLEHLNPTSITPVSHAVEQAKIRQAHLKVNQARESITQFKTNLPWTDCLGKFTALQRIGTGFSTCNQSSGCRGGAGFERGSTSSCAGEKVSQYKWPG